MPLSSKVDVRTGGIAGNCWFARDDIKKGEKVWWAGEWDKKPEMLVHVDTMKKWSKEEQERFLALAYQVEENIYSGFPPGIPVPEVLHRSHCDHYSYQRS